MKRLVILFELCLLMTVLLPARVNAGHISLVIQTTVKASSQTVSVEMAVTNQGDEAALIIYPELRLGTSEAVLSRHASLAVGEHHSWQQDFATDVAGITLPGVYPLYITLNYHDSNMYPSSMPEVVLFQLGAEASELLFASSITVTDVQETGTVTLVLRNAIDRPLAGTLQLFLPKELATPEAASRFSLAAGEEARIDYPVSNSSALAGSTYKIFAVAEFDDSGSHYSVLLSELLKIQPLAELERSSQLLAGSAVLLVLLFSLTLFWELKRSRAGDGTA